ncbi:MAG: sugar phosphate isomerase/epimerase [Planctomycetes bacterium]|nr:sugar phosphate isomerase/epimerase [Planctomycetota bacterium]
MKIGVFTVLFSKLSLEEMLDKVASLGLGAVELGTGNYPGSPHLNVKKLLGNLQARTNLLAAIKSRGLVISGLSCHGNPLHPQKKTAKAHHDAWRDTVKLAKMLNIDVVNNFSGNPAGNARSTVPNWVTCPWPEDYIEAVQWQWDKQLVPYWKEEAKFARDYGVKVAFEMHPGFAVYNTETLLKLREACGKNIGANLDPSHLFWQGMDPLVVAKALAECIFHVHAKDCRIDPQNTALNGVLDTKHYGDELKRSWIFRTVGYGHDEAWWRDFVSILRTVGYDGTLSIEHEDSLMSGEEGLRKAIQILDKVVIKEKVGEMFWA